MRYATLKQQTWIYRRHYPKDVGAILGLKPHHTYEVRVQYRSFQSRLCVAPKRTNFKISTVNKVRKPADLSRLSYWS